MQDLISRQAAIDALCHIDEYNAKSVSAIKALPSAQPVVISKSENATECEDAVSRKELHRLFEDQWHYLQCLNWSENPKAEAIQSGVNWCINTLHDMPSVTPKQPGWIPCSERLPENGHYYLWCSDMGHVQSDYYWNGFEDGMKYGYNIVAWCELPTPYREGGQE